MKSRALSEEKNVLLRDAVNAVYQGNLSLDGAHEALPAVPKDSINARVQLLPAGLVDNHETMGLSRALNKVCGLKRKQQYTEAEQRAAAYEFKRSVDTKTRNDIHLEYGISTTALKCLGKRLLAEAGRDPSDAKLKQVSESMHIPRPGQSRNPDKAALDPAAQVAQQEQSYQELLGELESMEPEGATQHFSKVDVTTLKKVLTHLQVTWQGRSTKKELQALLRLNLPAYAQDRLHVPDVSVPLE